MDSQALSDTLVERLRAIQRRFLQINFPSPKDVSTKKDVQFILERLWATEQEAVRLLGLLEARTGKESDAPVRLLAVRAAASRLLDTKRLVKKGEARGAKG